MERERRSSPEEQLQQRIFFIKHVSTQKEASPQERRILERVGFSLLESLRELDLATVQAAIPHNPRVAAFLRDASIEHVYEKYVENERRRVGWKAADPAVLLNTLGLYWFGMKGTDIGRLFDYHQSVISHRVRMAAEGILRTISPRLQDLYKNTNPLTDERKKWAKIVEKKEKTTHGRSKRSVAKRREEFLQHLRETTNTEEIRMLLKDVSYPLFNWDKLQLEQTLVSISSLTGKPPKGPYYREQLEAAGIPVGVVERPTTKVGKKPDRFLFIAAQHEAWARAVLNMHSPEVVVEGLKKTQTVEEVRQLFEKVDKFTLKYDTKQEAPSLLKLSSLVGFKKDLPYYIRLFEESGIPVGQTENESRRRVFFIASSHEEKAREVLATDPNNLAERIRRAQSDEDLQELLNRVDRNFFRSTNPRLDNPVLISMRSLTGDPVYVPHHAQLLQEAGIPVGKVEYTTNTKRRGKATDRLYFIAARDRERALEIIKKASGHRTVKPEATRRSSEQKRKLAQELQEAQDVDELTEALRKVDKHFLEWDRKQETPVLISVGTLAGLHGRRVPKCAEMLAETGILVGVLTHTERTFYDPEKVIVRHHYLVRLKDRERALAALSQAGINIS